jgi:uncharacterized membrane protein (UPF0127 family)
MLDIKICRSNISKLRGLMFSRRRNLLFIFDKPRVVSLHMLFVFYRVDAFILDKDMRILDIFYMKPFRIGYKSWCEACYVLEVSEQHNYRVGDIVGDCS